jgi:hypothetical protein
MMMFLSSYRGEGKRLTSCTIMIVVLLCIGNVDSAEHMTYGKAV